jgi:hypothetical protein
MVRRVEAEWFHGEKNDNRVVPIMVSRVAPGWEYSGNRVMSW